MPSTRETIDTVHRHLAKWLPLPIAVDASKGAGKTVICPRCLEDVDVEFLRVLYPCEHALCRKCVNRILGKQPFDLQCPIDDCGKPIKGTAPVVPIAHPPYHLHRDLPHGLAPNHPLPLITWIDPNDFAAWYQTLIAELGSYKRTLDRLRPDRPPGISSCGHMDLYSGQCYKVNVLYRMVVRVQNADRPEYRRYVADRSIDLTL